jgi:hypothetical protein
MWINELKRIVYTLKMNHLIFNFICGNDKLMEFILCKSKFQFPYRINSKNTKNMINVFLHETSINKTFNVGGAKLNIYVSLEPYETENKISNNFLSQFDIAIVSDGTINADNVVKIPNYIPWLYFKAVMIRNKHNLKFIEPKNELEKPNSDRILLISSNKKYYKSHNYRIELLNTFKRSKLDSKIDYYGFGFKDFESKIELLPRYRHAIVLECSQQDHYISEKLIDSLICGHNVLYWGSPIVNNYLSYPYIQNLSNNIDADIEEFSKKYHSRGLPDIKIMRDHGDFSAYNEANFLHKIVDLVEKHSGNSRVKFIKPNFYFTTKGVKKSIKLLRGLLK